MDNKQTKVVIIGLDGGTWDLLKPWADRGDLPNMQKLMKKGVWGDLASTVPPVTIPAWITFATGRSPGSHGCFNFLMPQRSLRDAKPIDRESVVGETFYEILENNNKTNIIVNMPGSCPPRIKKGVLLPSFITVNEQETHPPDLAKKIPLIRQYKVTPDISGWFGNGDVLMDASRRLESIRFRIAQKLFINHKWDLFFILFSASDWIQHRKYKYLIKGEDIKNSSAFKFYEEFDKYLGWFVKNLPSNTTLLFMSDHGFGDLKYRFHVNKWLREKGLLKINKIPLRRQSNLPLGAMQVAGVKPTNLGSSLLKKSIEFVLGNQFLYFISGEFARGLNRMLPSRYNFLPAGLLGAGIEMDIKSTLACCIPGSFSGIYINDTKRFKDGIVKEEDYSDLREEIIYGLKRIKTPEGKKVLNSVYRKEEIYSGSNLELAPDIIFQESDAIVPSNLLWSTKTLEKFEGEEGGHRTKGLILAYGPDIKKNKRIIGSSLQDIAPTVLQLFGLKPPDEMEGEVLKDIFKGSRSGLEKRLNKSKEVILEALTTNKYKDLAVAWTGGKDSTLILWLVREVCRKEGLPLPKIVFIDEGDLFDEVKEFVKFLMKKWKFQVDFVCNEDVLKQVENMGDIVRVYKLNTRNKKELERLKFAKRTFFFEPESFVGNHLMKTVPLNIYLEKNKIGALFTGIRWDEHGSRSKEKYFSSRKKPSHMRIHPILHYKEADVWEATQSLSIPYNPLYEVGYRSLGVKSSTKKTSNRAAWDQDLKRTRERQGRRQDKEKIMARLRKLGYM